MDFVVLFGSMARGDWSRGSDYDLIVGLAADGQRRFLDRLGDFGDLGDGLVEPLPYYPREVERMFRTMNGLLLDALRDGIPLLDRRGTWASYRARLDRMLQAGLLERREHGWRWTREAEEAAAAG